MAQGRYEMNGAVWVECDCNLVGGEALIRQFLWGQRYTRDTFGVLSDCFWLPDTFGYSAAIPQIMRGFGVKYFLTTKLAWNDTNTFPYETFTWRGIDGTDVLAHFFVMDTGPTQGAAGACQRRRLPGLPAQQTGLPQRLIAFGYGDGGGPQFEMIETARRLADLGLPQGALLQRVEVYAEPGGRGPRISRIPGRALSGAAPRNADGQTADQKEQPHGRNRPARP
ncbi:MAG: hypothetical protein ACLVJ8_14600 [Ruthenibacterium lactatiformans]